MSDHASSAEDKTGVTMAEENTVLCASNKYTQKYYFNPKFDILPQDVKNELKIMCVLFTEQAGGILSVEFDRDGLLELRTEASDADAGYDEIEAGLKIKELQDTKRELFASLELFYKVFTTAGRITPES
jgi:hypothetical protein